MEDKRETTSIRMRRNLKKALKLCAKKETRSFTNLVEFICEEHIKKEK